MYKKKFFRKKSVKIVKDKISNLFSIPVIDSNNSKSIKSKVLELLSKSSLSKGNIKPIDKTSKKIETIIKKNKNVNLLKFFFVNM